MAKSRKVQYLQDLPEVDQSAPNSLSSNYAADKPNPWKKVTWPKDERNDARLDFRLTREQKELIEEAACLLGQTVSDFAVATLVEKALKTTQRSNVTTLSNRDWELFLKLLDSGAEPNAALKRAVKRYKKHYG